MPEPGRIKVGDLVRLPGTNQVWRVAEINGNLARLVRADAQSLDTPVHVQLHLLEPLPPQG